MNSYLAHPNRKDSLSVCPNPAMSQTEHEYLLKWIEHIYIYTPLKPWDTPRVSTSLFLFRIDVLVSLLFCGWWSRTAGESTIPSFVTLKNHQENWTLITAGPYDIFSCPQLHVNKTVFPVCKLPWWARTPQPRPQSAAAMAVQMEKGTMWLCIPG